MSKGHPLVMDETMQTPTTGTVTGRVNYSGQFRDTLVEVETVNKVVRIHSPLPRDNGNLAETLADLEENDADYWRALVWAESIVDFHWASGPVETVIEDGYTVHTYEIGGPDRVLVTLITEDD